jgi:hypothetical protein
MIVAGDTDGRRDLIAHDHQAETIAVTQGDRGRVALAYEAACRIGVISQMGCVLIAKPYRSSVIARYSVARDREYPATPVPLADG